MATFGNGRSSSRTTLQQAVAARDRVGSLLGHIADDFFLVEACAETRDEWRLHEKGRWSELTSREMKRKIAGYDQDDLGDWRAKLECLHYQHVRHQPPLVTRELILSPEGRESRLGEELNCKKCDEESRQILICKYLT